ncbi:glycoside hydrolase family 18 protein [[Candida] arabinofermentans NRRL YB-2248]|uniref:Glycoside hydrolase family 18 protein n=1 Tax=[Candida] arabinofermentans NRRL YB-2248 TaxID=983967 RepID=A0A1E4SVK1_9ASCO|nr:glycoside hydrolase family 18 protein [[Candida] arabinofermentans NRRL YB-2248]
MTIFAPFIYAWSLNDFKNFKISNLKECELKYKLNAVTLAFLTNDRFEEIESWFESIEQFKGVVILSIGGAKGDFYPDDSKSFEFNFNKLQKLLVKLGINSIDLDIEGDLLKDKPKLNKLIKIMHKISYNNPSFYISLTLPVEFEYGLNEDCIDLIKECISHGLKINIFNCMIMDYFTKLPRGSTSSWGLENIRILKLVNKQLCSLLNEKSSSVIWTKMGICPMIGVNDDYSKFTLQDWEKLLIFCKIKQIGLISYWSINRDQCDTKLSLLNPVKNVYKRSCCQTIDFEYRNKVYEIFKL